jgi:hypothetical protein
MSDRSSTVSAIGLQQPEHLPLRNSQHVRAILNAQASVIDLRQHLNTI